MKNCCRILFFAIFIFLSNINGYSSNNIEFMLTPNSQKKEKDKDKAKKRKEKEKLARQFYSQRKYDKVIEIFDDLYWDYPSSSNYIYYSYSLIGTGNYEKAEKVIRHQIKKNPQKVTIKIDLGSLLVNLGERKKAEKIFNDIINNLSKSEAKVKQVAMRFSNKLEYDYALKTYFKGREILGNDLLFSLEIAKIFEKKGQYELMFNEYLSLLNSDNKNIGRVTKQLQDALNNDKDQEKSTFLFEALLKKVREQPDNKIYNELISWMAIQQKDFNTAFIYTKALEKRFDYQGKKMFELGNIAFENNDYIVAEKAFKYCIENLNEDNPYFVESHILKLTSTYYKIISSKNTNQIAFEKMESELQQHINNFPLSDMMVPSYIQLSEIKNYYLDKTDESTEILLNILEGPLNNQSKSKVKIQLAKLFLFNNNPWEATLLYSQVEKSMKNTPIGNKAKYENAMLSYYIGEFDWAKAKFDILKASTSKLIANDALYMSLFLSENMSQDSTQSTLKSFAKSDLLFLRKKVDESLELLDSLEASHNSDVLTDDILYKKAQIYEYQERFNEADSIYNHIFTNYSTELLADNALMNSIRINLQVLKDKEKSKILLKKMLTDYKGSLFTNESRTIFRRLRDDSSR